MSQTTAANVLDQHSGFLISDSIQQYAAKPSIDNGHSRFWLSVDKPYRSPSEAICRNQLFIQAKTARIRYRKAVASESTVAMLHAMDIYDFVLSSIRVHKCAFSKRPL